MLPPVIAEAPVPVTVKIFVVVVFSLPVVKTKEDALKGPFGVIPLAPELLSVNPFNVVTLAGII